MSEEKRLIKHLLGSYEKVGVVGRPVFNTSDTVDVKYGLSLIQILDLDEKNQVLTTNVWTRYEWHDILLHWNEEEFGGVKEVRVPSNQIWSPDIVLYNYADTRLKEHRDCSAVVSSDGTVMWIPPAIFKSTCKIDILNFPFDIQICTMKFGSWTYDGNKVDINFYNNEDFWDITNYIESNEWQLIEYPAVKNVIYYPCCPDAPYPDLTFTIKLKRIAAFYNYILTLPCVLLSSLTLVIFWLPPESPAKMMLGINIFVAFFVLLLLLADSTPPAAKSIPLIGMNIFVAFFLLLILLADLTPPSASNVPLIGAYFCLNMILITLSTFLSVIVINLYFRGEKKTKVPQWLKRIMVDGLARVMCMNEVLDEPKPPTERQLDPNSPGTHHRKHAKGERSKKPPKCPELKYNKFQPPPQPIAFEQRCGGNCDNASATQGLLQHPQQSNVNHTPGKTAYGGVGQFSGPAGAAGIGYECGTLKTGVHSPMIESDVREIKRILRTYIQRLNEKDAHEKVAKEWRIVARVLDRLFFFMYSWRDILLQWRPEDFGGVTEVRVPGTHIWRPDIKLYNFADTRLDEIRECLAVVNYTGEVFWMPTAIFKSSCAIDIQNFPYDIQTCHMKFGSWTYDGYKLDIDFIEHASLDIGDYIESNEWSLVGYPAVKNIKHYPCCPEPYPDLTFTIKLKRSPIFYSYVIVLPCVLLSFLTLSIFFIPPESPAKTLLGMNIFVAFFLLLRILAASTPPASEHVPLIGAYFCLNMILITLSSFISVTVINLYGRKDKKNKLPSWLRKLAIDGMARLFRMIPPALQEPKRPQSKHEHVTYTTEMGKRRERKRIRSPVLQSNKFDTTSGEDVRNSPLPTRCHTPEGSPVFQPGLEQDIKDIKRAFRQFQNRVVEQQSVTRQNLEWRTVALALDRLFFFIYLSTIIVSLCTIFPWD